MLFILFWNNMTVILFTSKYLVILVLPHPRFAKVWETKLKKSL